MGSASDVEAILVTGRADILDGNWGRGEGRCLDPGLAPWATLCRSFGAESLVFSLRWQVRRLLLLEPLGGR
jgi:hypothetical protein